MTQLKTPSQNLKTRIEATIKGDGQHPVFSLATLLHGGSLLYHGLMHLRNTLYRRHVLPVKKLPCPVISVGNVTVGGTGKTPMTLHLAEMLRAGGLRVAVVSRGYGRLSEETGTVVSDGRSILCDAAHAGDEPYLMAHLLEGVPVVVGQDRYAAGHTAWSRFKPDLILLDDAFQHQRLWRDLNLVLLDAQSPYGNGHLLPRGPLREPLTGLKRADAIILTRSADRPPPGFEGLVQQAGPRPIFRSFHKTVKRGLVLSGIPLATGPLFDGTAHQKQKAPERLFAFSGLAHNKRFWDKAAPFGKVLAGQMGFDDHHPYGPADIDGIVAAAQQAKCTCLVTTDKDFMRLPSNTALPMDLMVLGVEIQFKADKERWRQFIGQRLDELTHIPKYQNPNVK